MWDDATRTGDDTGIIMEFSTRATPGTTLRLNLFETTVVLSLKIVSAFVLYAVETLGECDSNLALEGHKPNTSPISLKRPLRSQGGKAGRIGPLSLGSPQRHMDNERIT